MLLMLIANFITLVYLGHYRPFLTRLQNYVEWYNQLNIMVVCVHMLFFTDWVPDYNTRIYYGYSMIIIICLHTLVSLIFVIYFLVQELILLCKWLAMLLRALWNYCMVKPEVIEPEEIAIYSINYLIMQSLNAKRLATKMRRHRKSDEPKEPKEDDSAKKPFSKLDMSVI